VRRNTVKREGTLIIKKLVERGGGVVARVLSQQTDRQLAQAAQEGRLDPDWMSLCEAKKGAGFGSNISAHSWAQQLLRKERKIKKYPWAFSILVAHLLCYTIFLNPRFFSVTHAKYVKRKK
jgi:hypothetical protein